METFSKYQGVTMTVLYTSNGKDSADWANYREIQVRKYPFHSGLQVRCTNGYTILSERHCETIWQAKNELRRMINRYIKGI